jgi:2-methylcitrate dehydratase
MTNNLAEKLSQYAHSLQLHQIDDESIIEAKKRILDSLGCAIGGFNEKPAKKTRQLIQNRYLGKAATVLGTNTTTTPDIATFANGLLIRYFDFNDTYLSKEPAHPSDNISACLAAAETNCSKGKDLLVAIILAYEIQCRLCDAANLRSKGWDHVCYGLVSSALGAGRLFGLNVEKLTNAVNISLNSHIAMRQVRAGNLSDWKGFSFANAARNAVFSTLLAREGITGPSPIFEGEMGFFHQVSGEFDLDLSVFGGREGTHFKLPETYIKYYPAEYHSQSAIWAALEARKQIEQTKNILSVDIETHEAGYTILGSDPEKWAPKTKETADHSLPFIVGKALLEGKIENSSYSQNNLVRPDIVNFLKKIKVREDKNFTLAYPSEIANRIIVKLSDGRTVTEQVNIPKGHPRNPMSQDEVVSKFKFLTKKFLSEKQTENIIDFVWSIEKQKDISLLMKLCVIKS